MLPSIYLSMIISRNTWYFIADYDPKIIEQFETQQPTCLPLSYVLKFFSDLPPSNEEKSNLENSKLKQTLLSWKPGAQQINGNSNDSFTSLYYNNKIFEKK